jgi:hypothetical protein
VQTIPFSHADDSQAWNEVRWTAVAQAAVEQIGRATGFTIDPLTALPLPRPDEDCFAVSLDGASRELTSLSLAQVRCYLRDHASQLLQRRGRQVYFGGWRPDRGSPRVLLDLVVLIGNGDEARDVGRRQRQDCIYNLRTGEEIWLRHRGRAAA